MSCPLIIINRGAIAPLPPTSRVPGLDALPVTQPTASKHWRHLDGDRV